AAAIGFSSLVALTLTPMMSSQLFTRMQERGRLAAAVDRGFERLSAAYERALEKVVAKPLTMMGVVILTIATAAGLFLHLPSEYSPREDRGVYYVIIRAAEGASLEYTDNYARQMEQLIMRQVETGDVRRVQVRIPGDWSGGVSSARALVLLEHWDNRERSAFELADEVREALADMPLEVHVSTPAGLGVRGGGDRPVAVVLGGGSYETLEMRRDQLLEGMEANPMFVGMDSDYEERQPQMRIQVDRNRAAALGVSLTSIGRTLETM